MNQPVTDDHSSVFSKGGGGTVFELSVQTAFIITLLLKGKVPGLPTGELNEVAFQTTRLGFHTDDLLIRVRSHQGEHKLLAQIKHNLSITSKNATFEEVMTAFWQDFINPTVFNPLLDRLVIIKSTLTQSDRQDTLILLNWAKSKASAADFYLEVNRIDSKKKTLAIFSEVLQKVNAGVIVDDEQLWRFLRCLMVLDYDFSQESSQSKTNFLNLLELCKNRTASISASEIWDSVFAYVAELNKNGGSVTLESLQDQAFAAYFELARLNDSYSAIKKLQDDSQAILGPLTDTIAGLHLPRPELRNRLAALLSSDSLTIVTGEPGTGKSAIIKEVVSELTPNTTVLTFKADQFNQSQLGQVFSGLGVSNSLVQLTACLAAIPQKVVFIDSLEKLLEGDPDNAFRQLMQFLNGIKGVNVVASSRTYAVELLIQKYALSNVSVLEVALLSEGEEGEFEQVLQAFPKLRPLASNPQIRHVLRSPKYLDFAVRWVNTSSDNLSELTLTEFKNRLWQHIVENHSVVRAGMPSKRNKAFMEVALLRAQRMTLYAEPELADPAAIDELVNDNILTKQSNELKYAPSHDILEDWALVKHIRRLRETHHEPEAFYQNIGNKPALRRAFRLWVEDSLRNRAATVFELIRETRQQAFIEPYWADEVLVAILRSDESFIFFEEFETELLEDQAQFLQRTIHLLRTACKEHQTSHTHKLLYPVGSGWMATLSFIHLHLARLGSLRILITSLLIDWSYSLYKDSERLLTREVGAVRGILFTYLEEIENKEEKAWQEEPLKNRVKSLLDVTFELTEYAKSEVQALLERAIPKPTDRYDYHDKSFYGRIRKMTLSGIYSRPLTKFLPEQVIAMAKATWIKKPRLKTSEHSKNVSPILRILEQQQDEDDYYSFDKNRQFGFENHIDDSPSGIYKTPVYNLLRNNWKWGIDFLLEMIYHCTSHYVKSREALGDEVVEIELKLSNGQLVKQSGSRLLWQAYRGTVVSSYLLESLLMSLEAFLIETAEAKTDVSRHNIKYLFNYLLHNSNSVAISSVLVSVAIAYPYEVGEAMLPLLGVREFYEWDVHRALDDQTNTLAPWDNEISFAQKKRHELNELPHRKKYGYGLKGFVLDLQLNLKLFNEAFFSVLDRMWEQADEQDLYWRKTLHEIDTRKWQITEHKSELGGFIIEPVYEPSVKKLVDDFQPERESQEQAAVASIWIRNIYERKEEAVTDYSEWTKIFERYRVNDNFNFVHDRPISLAVIGLRDLNQELSPTQRSWCFKAITKAINRLIMSAKRRDNYLEVGFTISPFDRDAALTALPLLLKTTNGPQKRKRVIKLLLQALVSSFHRIEMDPLLASLREQLWEADALVANQVWQGLIRFAQLRKAHEKNQWRAYQNDELQKEIEQTESEFILDIATSKNTEHADFKGIKLTTWHSHLLTRALMMLPFNTQEEEHIDYRKIFIPLFLKGLDKDFAREERIDRRPLIYDDDRVSLQEYLRDLFLYCDHEKAADVTELLLNHAFQILSATSNHRDGGFDYVQWTLRRVIWELDQIVSNQFDKIGKRVITNFWRIWERFYQVLSQSGYRVYSNLLFLEIDWKKEATHWRPLEGKKYFVKRVTDTFGQYNIRPLVKLLSTIGDQTLLPDGLHWVVDIIKNHPENLPALAQDEAELLINRLYQRHISFIKTNASLLKDFVWLLDKMVDLGSSQAYITRENLITYKIH